MNQRLVSVGAEAAMVPQSRASPFAQGVVVGVLAAVAALVFAAVFFLALRTDRYDLDHWKLNFQTPVDSKKKLKQTKDIAVEGPRHQL